MFVLICKYASGTIHGFHFKVLQNHTTTPLIFHQNMVFFIRDSLSNVLICIIELSPNIVADIFYNGEIEGEH